MIEKLAKPHSTTIERTPADWSTLAEAKARLGKYPPTRMAG